MKKILHLLSSSKLAVLLLVYLGAFVALATFVPQAGMGIESPLAHIVDIPVVATVLRTLGLMQAYSSPLFLIPVALLFVSTSACTVRRIRVAYRRQSLFRKASSIIGGKIEEALAAKIKETLDEILFRKVRIEKRRIVAQSSLWSLYASPAFHVLLALIIVVILAGRMTRIEAQTLLIRGKAQTLAEHNLEVESRGPLYRFRVNPVSLRLLDTNPDFQYKEQTRGSAAKLALTTAQGKVAKTQWTFVNRPLTHGSLMIHQLGVGYVLAFTLFDADGSVRDTYVLQTQLQDIEGDISLENAGDLFSPVRIRLEPDDYGYVVFQLLPDIVGETAVAGSKATAYGRVHLTDANMQSKTENEFLTVGQTIELKSGESLRFDSMEDAATVKIVDDWSLPVLYVLLTLATVVLSIALLFCPRFCVICFDEKSGEPEFVTRFYRPHALDAKEVEKQLVEILRAYKESD